MRYAIRGLIHQPGFNASAISAAPTTPGRCDTLNGTRAAAQRIDARLAGIAVCPGTFRRLWHVNSSNL